MDDLYDDDRFTFPIPMWTLAAASKLATMSPSEATLRLIDPDGVQFIGLFTDEDLAERFVAASAVDGVSVVTVATEPDLVSWLETSVQRGTQHVQFDPATGRVKDLIRIADLLEFIRWRRKRYDAQSRE